MKFTFMSVTNWFGGRSFFLALVFLSAGIYLALIDKLSINFLGLAGGLQTLVSLRSVANDIYSQPPAQPVETPQPPQM